MVKAPNWAQMTAQPQKMQKRYSLGQLKIIEFQSWEDLKVYIMPNALIFLR